MLRRIFFTVLLLHEFKHLKSGKNVGPLQRKVSQVRWRNRAWWSHRWCLHQRPGQNMGLQDNVRSKHCHIFQMTCAGVENSRSMCWTKMKNGREFPASTTTTSTGSTNPATSPSRSSWFLVSSRNCLKLMGSLTFVGLGPFETRIFNLNLHQQWWWIFMAFANKLSTIS